MNERVSFGLWLKQRRKKLGLSQKELARVAHCSVVNITKIEAGERKPSKQIAWLLAQYFDVAPDERAAFVEFARIDWSEVQASTHAVASGDAPWRYLHALRTLEHLQRRPNNLPAQMTSFVGRDEAVSEITATLRQPLTRLVTIAGPPGIGKTRLSLQVVVEMLEEFRDGAHFVPLASISDAHMVAYAIAQTLKVRESGDLSTLENLKDYLRHRHTLLVLDNFEHILDAAPVVSELLSTAAGLKVIVTSREPLHIYGEHVAQVDPLALPAPDGEYSPEQLVRYGAIRLFSDRAMAVKPSFTLDNDNARTIIEICRHLDSLPLAIELAAARINNLPPDALLDRLGDRLETLVGGPHDLPVRQQTIRAAIDWSYDLLTPEEQTLFRQISVFAGSWTLAATQAVIADGTKLKTSVASRLDSLLAKNLLSHESAPAGEPRFAMLETIRAYAWEKLAESRDGNMQQRHAAYYLSVAEAASTQLTGAEQSDCLTRLELEHENFSRALNYATDQGDVETVLRMGLALWRFWELRGYPREGLRWLLRGLNAQADLPIVLLGSAYNAAGILAWKIGDYALAHNMHEQGLVLRRQVGDKLRVSGSLNNLGLVSHDLGEYEQARALFEESLQMCRELDDKADIASTLNNLAISTLAQGDPTSARALNEESLALWREMDDDYGIALSLNNLGEAARFDQDYATAQTLYEQTLNIYRELGYEQGMASVLHNLGHVARHQQELERATSLFRESLSLGRKLGEKRSIVECLAALAGVALSQGELRRSARLLAAANTILETVGAPLYAVDQVEYDRTLSAVRQQLRETEWDTAWAEGRAMTVEQAIIYALAEGDL